MVPEKSYTKHFISENFRLMIFTPNMTIRFITSSSQVCTATEVLAERRAFMFLIISHMAKKQCIFYLLMMLYSLKCMVKMYRPPEDLLILTYKKLHYVRMAGLC